MGYPTFTTGEVLTAASMNAVGMWLVKSQTIGSGSGTVVVPSAFSSDYDAYQIVVSGGATASGEYGLNMRLGSTVSGYYYVGEYRNYPNTLNNVINGNNASEWGAVGIATPTTLQANIFVTNPFLTKHTYFSAPYLYGNPVGGIANMGGYLADSNSYTSFTLFINASTFTGGTIRVYGFKK